METIKQASKNAAVHSWWVVASLVLWGIVYATVHVSLQVGCPIWAVSAFLLIPLTVSTIKAVQAVYAFTMATKRATVVVLMLVATMGTGYTWWV